MTLGSPTFGGTPPCLRHEPVPKDLSDVERSNSPYATAVYL
jgi:hypothetical protein